MLVQTLLDTESSRVCLDWKRLKKKWQIGKFIPKNLLIMICPKPAL